MAPNKYQLPFQLSISSESTSLLINAELPKEIKRNQVVVLTFESYPAASYGKVKSEIDCVTSQQNQA